MSDYSAIRDLEQVSPPSTPSPTLSRSVSMVTNSTENEHVIVAGTKEGPAEANIPIGPIASGQSTSTPQLNLPRSSQTWWGRFGSVGLLALIAGTVSIIICCSILIFLWAGAGQARRHEHRPQLWNFIIFSGRSISTVTICSAILRVSLGFQAGIITAAMASVILETSGVKFSDIASFSIHRSSFSGPSPLMPATLRQCFNKKGSGYLCCLVLSSTFLTALWSTFTSTILLSDFAIYKIPKSNTTRDVAIASRTIGHTQGLKGISFWHSPPPGHWRFAEAEPGTPLSVEGVIDTGDLYRATLPFLEEDDRASLEYYFGPAVVTNSRTACMGPAFESVRIDYSPPSNSTPPGLLLRAKFEAHIDEISNIGQYKYLPMTVECKLHNDWDTPTSTWPLTMCRVLTEASEQWFYRSHPRLLVNSSKPLNKFGIVTDWNYQAENYSKYLDQYQADFQTFTTKQEGPWTRVFNSTGSEVLQATVCFSRQIPEFIYNVTILGRAILSEPNLKAPSNKSNSNLLKQFGIGLSPNSLGERGILQLNIHEMEETSDDIGYDPYGFAVVLNSIDLGGWSLKIDGVGRYTPLLPTNWFLHPEHTALFQTIIQQTENPAKALQELTYRIYQMYFYNRQPDCDLTGQATTVNVVAMQLPDRWTGLIAVLVLIVLHLATLILAVILFAIRTRSSSLGQAWQSVSHVVSPQTQQIINEAGRDGVKDWHVKWWAESTGLDVGLYSLHWRACTKENEISSQ